MEGRRLSHFEIREEIARGGMGVIYRALDLKLGRSVALKLLAPHLVADPQSRTRLVAEARAAAATSHPGIATIYEVGEEGDTTFIAMEYVEGETLRTRLARGPLPPGEALRIALEIASAVAAAHRAGVLHRDLKPENVMLTPGGPAKVLDFGVARLREIPRRGDALTMASEALLTQEGRLLGTPAYMAPEQARGRETDARTDIFAFGCVFFEMLTGRAPFGGGSLADTLSEVLRADPLPAAKSAGAVPPRLCPVLARCLAKSPEDRYADADALLRDLESLREGRAVKAAKEAGLRRTGRGALARGAVIVLVAAAAALAIWLAERNRSGVSPGTPAQGDVLAIFSFENMKDPQDPERIGQIMQELLVTALSEHPTLRVLSSQRLNDVREQTAVPASGRAAGGDLDRRSAGEVARLAGASAMLTGSMSQLGDKWIITCQIAEVKSGTVLKSKRVDGEDLYALVDRLTSEIRHDLSLAPPGDLGAVPIRDRTTGSMEAYRHYLEGVQLLDRLAYPEAAEELRRAIEIDPDFGPAHLKLAVALWWPGDNPAAARAPLVQLLDRKLYATSKEKLMAEGILSLIEREWARAIPIFKDLAGRYPDEKEAWYGLGEALFHSPGGGHIAESLEPFERAAALDPEFLLPYAHIFDVLQSEERYSEAVQRADDLIRREPENALWYRYRAVTLCHTARDEEVEAVIGRALEYQRTPADRRELFADAADVLRDRGFTRRAEELARRAMEADPGHDDVRLARRLVQSLELERRWDEAERSARESLERSPGSEGLRQDLLRILESTWRFAEARQEAERLAREQPEVSSWFDSWARLAIQEGDETAVADAERAFEQSHPSRDDRRRFLGSVALGYSLSGDYNRAIEMLQRAVALQPDSVDAEVLFGLAGQEMGRGRFDDAKTYLDRSLALNPHNTQAQVWRIILACLRGEEPGEEAIRAIGGGNPSPYTDPFLAITDVLGGRYERADSLIAGFMARSDPEWLKMVMLAEGPQAGSAGYGWVCAMYKRHEQAERVFRSATAYDMAKRDPRAHAGLGWNELLRGHAAAAKPHFEAGLRVGVGHDLLYEGLAAAALMQGDTKEARRRLRERMALGRRNAGVWRLAALAESEAGDFTEARRAAERAVAMDSTKASHEVLAWVLVEGRLDGARGAELARRAATQPTLISDYPMQLPFWPTAEKTLKRAEQVAAGGR